MGAVTCRACGQGESIAICSESGIPICANCAVSCNACNSPIDRERAQLTSTGRKLCSKCMAERNAKRRAKKDEMRREGASGKRESSRSSAAAPVGGGVAGASFEDLMRDDPTLSRTFKGIVRAEAPAPPAPKETPTSAGTRFEDLASEPPPSAAPAKGGKSAPRGITEPVIEGEDGKTFGLEGQAQEGSKRLTLGPIDDNRPILGQSGYQPPSKKAYLAAFCLFGLAGAIFWTVAPQFREILMPWRIPKYDFSSNLMPVAGDTNALRNTSNISQFDVISQGPIFFVAWFFVGIYVVGFVLIVWSVGRSLLSSRLAKRRLKKAEEYAKKHGYSYPG